MREGGAGQHRDVAGRRDVAGQIVEQLAARRVDALGTQHQIARVAGKIAQHACHVLGGGDDQQGIEPGHCRQIVGCANGGCQFGGRKEDRVAPIGIDRIHDVAFMRPQQYVAPIARQHLGQRRAPCARAKDTDRLHALTPAPRTGSAAGSSGQRGLAEMSSGSAAKSGIANRSHPAHAIIAALSVHSLGGGATKRMP